jgi:DNA-binding XRE family transcriptional regulator
VGWRVRGGNYELKGPANGQVRRTVGPLDATRVSELRYGNVVDEGRAMSDLATRPFHLDPDLFRAALGDALRARREEVGLSQLALADALDTRQARIWEWENGVHVIRINRLLPLCEALFTSPIEIMARAVTATRDGMRDAEQRQIRGR